MSEQHNTLSLLPSELINSDEQNEFKLKFKGKLNEVDASTLGYSLVNVTSLLQEVNNELGEGQKIEIKVKATEPGSFLVHLTLDASQVVPPLMEHLTAENVMAAAKAVGAIIGTLSALIGLRKVLKGDPPKEITQKEDVVQIQNNSGNTTIITDQRTYNIYFNNPKVNEALSKTFKALESDPNIEGFAVTDEKEVPVVEVEREEFHPMALTSSVPQAQTRSITQRASLYIVKPSFERGLTWNVVYGGVRVSVTMEDERFLAAIDEGFRLGKGDTLEVELKIDQVLDRNIGTYINKLPYHVLRVTDLIPRPEQTPLFQQGIEGWPSASLDAGSENFAFGKLPPAREDVPAQPKPKRGFALNDEDV
jgi:hypothetical protein